MIEKKISNFIETQFPEIYREEGQNFVLFTKKYYEWLEQTNNVTYHARNMLEYKDVDNTIDEFVISLKETYLKDIQLETASQTRNLIKHSLDLYRSKGTERSIDLFFRSVFGRPVEVYYPAEDIFRLSEGEWVSPKYLEISLSEKNKIFVGKQIKGITSGSTAFAERLIKRKIKNKYINVLYISAITGEFITGEYITLDDENIQDAPVIVGSLTEIEVLSGGQDFKKGDIVNIVNNSGKQGKARVDQISDVTGVVSFSFDFPGWGYSADTKVLVSENVLFLQNATFSLSNGELGSFKVFEKIYQPMAELYVNNASASLSLINGDKLFRYFSNGAVAAKGNVLSYTSNGSTQGTLKVSNEFGNLHLTESPLANLAGTISIANTTGFVRGKASINSTSSVTGIDSFYDTELLSGKLVVFYVYNSNNQLLSLETRQINSITNSTFFTVNIPLTNSSNNVIVRNQNNKTIVGTGTSFNTNFVYGNRLAIHANSSYQLYCTVNSVTNSTFMSVQEDIPLTLSGVNHSKVSSNSRIFTQGNSIYMNVVTYVDTTVSANLIGYGSNNVLYLSNSNITPFVNSQVFQLNANNVEIANASFVSMYDILGSNSVITVSDTVGTFYTNNNYTLYMRNANNIVVNSNAKIYSIDTTVGVINTAGSFVTTNNNIMRTSISNSYSSMYRKSQGVFAGVDIVKSFQYPESFQFYFDPLQDYLSLPLNSSGFGFPSSPAANISTNYLENILSNYSKTIGGLTQIASVNPGKNYDVAPFVNIVEEDIYRMDREDYSFLLSNISANFTTGELITQPNGAKGLVFSSNNNQLEISRINFNNNFNLSLQIVGEESGATANIVSISELDVKLQIGLNGKISANVQSSKGSITKLKIVDSGFGYLNNQNADIVSLDGTREATGRLLSKTKGTSEGYYRTNDGFLSDIKKLYDGEYYQEYSYEIQTAISSDKYSEMLKKILHVAGTKAFFAIFISSNIDNNLNVETEITQ